MSYQSKQLFNLIGVNEITYKEKTQNNTLSIFTVSERNPKRVSQKSSEDFISHVLQLYV